MKQNVNMIKYIAPILLILASCQAPKQNETSNEEKNGHPLVGEWRNTTLHVEVDKKQGEPSSILELDESAWEEKLHIRPIQTFFTADGKFNSEHYNLQDSLILNPEGTWTTTGEEITMITLKPFNDTTSCTYSIEGDLVTFGCWVDWDEDGEKDDWYLGVQKKY